MSLSSILRHIQGERRGMGSELRAPALDEIALDSILRLRPTITVQTDVQLADTSFWQGEVNFDIMRTGLAGVIIRAGQRYWVDSQFKVNWQKARTAGIPRGSYFFYDSREDPKKQAALWWSQIKDDLGELVHCADFEESYGGPFGEKSHFKEFILEFQRLSALPDRKIAIYTGYWWWLDRVGNDVFFRSFSLWLAWYSAMSIVKVPPPWIEGELLLWQYTSSGNGAAYGVGSREIDLNYYCCDLAHFKQRFGLAGGQTPPPETGESMFYKVIVSVLNIRSGPGTSYQDIGDVLLGDVLEVSETIGGWHHIKGIVRGGSPISLPSATNSWCSASATYVEPYTPPAAPAFPSEIGITIGGTTKTYIVKP